jgi:hypothetical protein
MPDRYLKAVLTVIAAALVALAVENGTTISRADSGPMKVQVCNEGGCARECSARRMATTLLSNRHRRDLVVPQPLPGFLSLILCPRSGARVTRARQRERDEVRSSRRPWRRPETPFPRA